MCKIKTQQSVSWKLGNDFILIELLRGEERAKKTHAKITYDPNGIIIQDQLYHLIASAHHTGSISSGHWITKIKAQKNLWFSLDGLKSVPIITKQYDDGSLTFLLVMKKTKIPSSPGLGSMGGPRRHSLISSGGE